MSRRPALTALPADTAAAARSWRKPCRDQARSSTMIRRAIPQGSQRAADGTGWLLALRDEPAVRRMRSDGRTNLLAIASALTHGLDPVSVTTWPGWDYLVATTDLNWDTVGSHLRRLRDLGYLGVVLTGRMATEVPRRALRAGQSTNDRAVYVLTVPVTLSAVDTSENHRQLDDVLAQVGSPVDDVGRPDELSPTPRTPEGFVVNPQHAREQSNADIEPLRGPEPESGGAPGGAAALPHAHRQQCVYPAQATVAGTTRREARDAQSLAVRELQRLVPVLRPASPAFLAWACRPYFVAGWTVDDIIHAIDHRPDDQRIPHDGADGIASHNLARWVQHRLTAWLGDNDRPQRSRSQRLAAERHLAAAQRRAAIERSAADHTARARGEFSPPPGWTNPFRRSSTP